ncbi:WD40 repeat-like protein, partial [Jaminaea rosea]
LHPRPSWAGQRRELPGAVVAKAQQGEVVATTLTDLLARDSGLTRKAATSSSSGGRRRPLPPGQLEIQRQRDVQQHPAPTRFDDDDDDDALPATDTDLSSAIESLSFHPTSRRTRLLCTASRDRRVRLYNVDGRDNPLLQTIHVPSLPLRKATWHPSGQSILLAGPRPYLYSYDVQSGKALRSTPWRGASSGGGEGEGERDLSMAQFQPPGAGSSSGLLAVGGRRGHVHLLDWGRSPEVASSTSEGGGGGGRGGGSHLLHTLSHNAPLAGLAWDPSPSHTHQLLSLGQDGSFQQWDTRTLRCPLTVRDSGLHAPNSLAASPDGQRWAVGTQSGIVALYTRDALLSPTSGSGLVEPTKSLSNLITSTSSLTFDQSSQILGLASRSKKDALRLAHAGEGSVYANWPTSGTPVGRVSDLAFDTSAGRGGVVAVGNTRGRTLLFSLGHFS